MQRLNNALECWKEWNLPLTEKPMVIQPLKGGLTNQLYLINNNKNHLVLRLNNPNSKQLGINRLHEKAILNALEPLQIAPRLLHTDSHLNFSVFEYIMGQTHPSQPMASATQQKIARAITRIQSITGLALPRFDYYSHLLTYWSQLTSDQQSTISNQWKPFLQRLREFQQSDWTPVLSHHDINPNNVLLLSDGRIKIIDWEYAGMGHPDIDPYVATGACSDNPFIPEMVQWMERLWFMQNP